MSGNEVTDKVLAELVEYGIKGAVVERGKHLGVAWVWGGRTRTLFCSRTPSDVRTWLNTRAELRRQLKADGVQPVTPEQRVRTLTHALSAPKPAEAPDSRVERLQSEVSTLLDMVSDLQQHITRVEQKLSSLRVVSTITFEAPAGAPVVTVAAPSAPQKKRASKVSGTGPKANLLRALASGRYVSRQDLMAASGSKTAAAASQAITKLRRDGLIEPGLRGQWRLTADAKRDLDSGD